MAVEIGGVRILCEKCVCIRLDDAGVFDVRVPVSGADGVEAGTAVLRCDVSGDRHRVELQAWSPDQGGSGLPVGAMRERIDAALRFVADRQLCGKERLCPYNVVELARTQAELGVRPPLRGG